MKIKRLYIKNYKKMIEREIIFNSKDIDSNLQDFYSNVNVSALIGINGSGKTTVLSCIVKIFRYIQRDQEKIPTEFELEYSIKENDVKLEMKDKSVYITIDNIKKLLLEMKRVGGKSTYFRKKHQKEIEIEDTTFDEIRELIPPTIIVSGYDIDYDVPYHNNLICDKFVKLNRKNYFETSVGLDVSLGISRFFEMYFDKTSKLKRCFGKLGFVVQPYVKLRFTMPSLYLNEEPNKFSRDRIKLTSKYSISVRKSYYKNFFDELRDFSEKYNVDYDNFLEYVASGDVFKGFVIGEYDHGFNWKFDLSKFVQKKVLIELLEILINNKIVYINDIFLMKDIEYSMEQMSTGEKQILGRIFFMMTHLNNNSVVIFEEPEVHLNFFWVKQLISIFLILLEDTDVNLLLSSHNFNFINNLQSEQVLILNNDGVRNPDKNIFLVDDALIGEFITEGISEDSIIEEYIYNLIYEGEVEKLKYFFEIIGESYIKVSIFKKLIDLGVINVDDK